MKTDLLLEINRINELLGTRQIIVENTGKLLTFIDNLARQSPKLFDNFNLLIKAAKVKGRDLTDSEIDSFVQKCKKAGAFNDSEAAAFSKALKNDKEIRAVLNSTEDFYTGLKNLGPDKEIPVGFSNINKLVNLTQAQIDEVIRKAANTLLKDTTHGIGAIYAWIDKRYGDWLNRIISEGKMINSVDEIYDTMDSKLNEIIQKQVADGKISAADAKTFYDEISEELRCCSKTKTTLDDMTYQGRTAKKPKTTTKPKYGDTNPAPDVNGFVAKNADGTDAIKPKSNFEKSEFYGDKVPVELSFRQRVWINTIEPYMRWWLTTLKLWFDDMFKNVKGYGNKYLDDFNQSFKNGLEEYFTAGDKTKISNAYFRDIIEKFQQIPRQGDVLIPEAGGNVYNALWDDFVANAKIKLKDDPKKLEEFYEFTNKLVNFKGGFDAQKTIAMKELLGMADGATYQVEKSFTDNLTQSITYIKDLSKMAAIKKKIGDAALFGVEKAWYLFRSGTFSSPADFSRAITKEMRKNVKLARRGGVDVFSTAFSKQAATKNFLFKMLMANVVFPAIASLIEAIYEGYFATKNIRLIDRPLVFDNPEGAFGKGVANYISGYLIYDILTGIKMDDLLYKVMGDKRKAEWTEYLAIVPGMGDNILIAAIKLSAYGLFAGGGDMTSDEAAKKEVDRIKKQAEDLKNKGKKVIKTIREVSEQVKNMSKSHDTLIKYYTKRNARLTTLQQGLMMRFTRSEQSDNTLWVEDPYVEGKKYVIIENKDFDFQRDKDNANTGLFLWNDNGTYKTIKALADTIFPKVPTTTTNDDVVKDKILPKLESRYTKTNSMITERNKEKFGEDNFKHWKDTFTFKAQDEKNPGQYKEVKIKMEDVMDRINHYRKKYDEDDSFVRAVIDTHEDVVKIMFTKDLANIHESATPRGLALVLRVIKESRGEMEIFSVARPANGNWFLVKGDYTPNQLANMDLEKKEPRTKETEVNSKSEDDLKKKEESAINVLKRNEKEGIEDLPKKIRDKVREKMGKGWTTETPPEELKEYFTTSEINSIFNDKIVIYKLEPTKEFFNNLVKFSARIVIKRGFCRTLKSGRNELELSERQKMTVNHILNKCNTKYESKLGLRNF
jgi:polyhydroxyalkanoate synthesis regulator phasin